jgi:hypothetical protein
MTSESHRRFIPLKIEAASFAFRNAPKSLSAPPPPPDAIPDITRVVQSFFNDHRLGIVDKLFFLPYQLRRDMREDRIL